ncbi:protein ROOT INITIATION DEFECTIVE 3-like [Macadamia integrifolia]|uniref:protein ROOT INITIATION DEFECTIVE 3-like n=1 Tax=Macadamia integrifolia TaxID=60698 RepID=UPI001C4EBFE9|nr:protein ROOT INITIATION DEFECTIVE 3-like [Macadamia integrifolia]
MKNQIHELQQQGSSAASEMELEKLKLDCKRSLEMVQKWKKMYEDLHHYCVDELLDGGQTECLLEIPPDNNWALEVKKSIQFSR